MSKARQTRFAGTSPRMGSFLSPRNWACIVFGVVTLGVLLLLGMSHGSPSNGTPNAANTPVANESSEDAVRKTAMAFPDKLSGKPVMIFEPVHNRDKASGEKILYLGPLGYILPAKTTGERFEHVDMGEKVRYTFQVMWYHEGMWERTMERYKERYGLKTDSLSEMAISMIRFEVEKFPQAEIEVRGYQRLHLPIAEGVPLDFGVSLTPPPAAPG